MSITSIRTATTSDAARIAEIYNHYIKTNHCTFEEEPVSTEEMRSRIETTLEHYPYLVLETDQHILGYAYGTRWKVRSAYRYTVELSVYVDHEEHGKGYGKVLYQLLVEELKNRGFKRLIGGIALPNPASIRLHNDLGFSHSGTLKRVGIKFGKWIDVAYYMLEV